MKSKKDKLLTAVELELMNLIWELGPCTVGAVHQALPRKQGRAYTSVATMMKILEGKGILGARKNSWPHIYEPLVGRAEYEARSLRHLRDNVFQGSPSSLVMRLLDSDELTVEEIQELKRLLDERLPS